MAHSSCPKCNHPHFEMQENVPEGSNVKFHFIQCAACGAVIGVVDYYDIGNAVTRIEATLERITDRLDV